MSSAQAGMGTELKTSQTLLAERALDKRYTATMSPATAAALLAAASPFIVVDSGFPRPLPASRPCAARSGSRAPVPDVDALA